LVIREVMDFEKLGEEVLVPSKSGRVLRGFDGKNYVECEL